MLVAVVVAPDGWTVVPTIGRSDAQAGGMPTALEPAAVDTDQSVSSH
jgi:hypothetical protein